MTHASYRPYPKYGEGNIFSLFVRPHLGCTPSPSHNTSTVPMFFPGGTPVTGQDRWDRYPGQVQMGYPGQGWSPSQSGMGTPRDRIADGVLDMWRAVCLFRSRRRTSCFFYSFIFLTTDMYEYLQTSALLNVTFRCKNPRRMGNQHRT